MESEKERYYRAKNQELNRAKDKESSAELITLLLFIVGAVVAVAASLIILSPGIFPVAIATYYLSLQPSWLTAWLTGLSLSLILLFSIYFSTKNKIKTAIIYAILATVSSITLYYYPTSANQTLVSHALNIYLPVLNPKADLTSEENNQMTEKSTDNHSTEINTESSQLSIPTIESEAQISSSDASKLETDLPEQQAQSTSNSQPIVINDSNSIVRPSFDCSLASHQFEVLVCENPELSVLDVQLNSLYTTTRAQLSPKDKNILLEQQRNWINQSRLCNTAACISNAYQMRMEQISTFQIR